MHTLTRKLAALPLLALPLAASEAPTRAVDGYVIAMSIKMEGGAAPTPMPGPMNMTLKVAGSKIRIEMDMSAMMGGAPAGAGEMMAGMYMLAQEDGRMAMIMPKAPNPMTGGTGMGVVMDAKSIMGAMNAAGAAVPSITDMSVMVDDLGAGEKILGRNTKKYRITQSFTMNGQPQKGSSEVWITTELGDAEAGFKKFTETFGSQFVNSLASKDVVAQVAAKTPPGLALRTIAVSDVQGVKTTTTMEITKAEKASFEASEFELPAGIQLIDPMAMGGRGRGGAR